MNVDQPLTPEIIREFVIASHFNLDKVRALLTQMPALLNVRHQWGENDFEDGLGAAAHVGNRPIAECFLEHGSPLTIFAAAMLGRTNEVATFLKADPALANGHGAHHISILFHAALSGDTALTTLLLEAGCTEGYDDALHAAIMRGHLDMVIWLLQHGAKDLQVLNYEGKSPLKKAIEQEHTAIADVLRSRGAVE
jgi:ankyrin repeat protein